MCVMWQVCHLPLFLPFSSSLPRSVALPACGREGGKKNTRSECGNNLFFLRLFFGGSILFLRYSRRGVSALFTFFPLYVAFLSLSAVFFATMLWYSCQNVHHA